MAKHGESEGEVLSREEMKDTKGGAGIPAGAAASAEAGLRKNLADTSLASEALNVLPTAQPAVKGAPPPPETILKR
jgi:hypothetical protein